jgi:hypothetical protein
MQRTKPSVGKRQSKLNAALQNQKMAHDAEIAKLLAANLLLSKLVCDQKTDNAYLAECLSHAEASLSASVRIKDVLILVLSSTMAKPSEPPYSPLLNPHILPVECALLPEDGKAVPIPIPSPTPESVHSSESDPGLHSVDDVCIDSGADVDLLAVDSMKEIHPSPPPADAAADPASESPISPPESIADTEGMNHFNCRCFSRGKRGRCQSGQPSDAP